MAAPAHTHHVLTVERESESAPPALRTGVKVERDRGKYHVCDDLNTGGGTSHSNVTCLLRTEDLIFAPLLLLTQLRTRVYV